TGDRCRLIAQPFHDAGLHITCLTGPAPLLDPDLHRRHPGIVRLHALIRHCRDFGTDRIVTETGSLRHRHPSAPYPRNRCARAWAELHLVVAEALRVAAAHGVTLLLKPESSHILATAEDAVRLRNDMDHPNLAFVMDPVNFLVECSPGELNARLELIF